ncbi:hypothetical protein NZD89_08145 [Alicyclobacillus fastidiosus]|uniref:Uncharacterized protein n=1 Tax=Alicyclobacillus fastidiosus TaxID=392011 RepID=A0ABY6ZKA6_9BACL|nr:hypothetical protein [Alicyclobacillus fastidiosus]WAH43350.1 hypothetical protein NZD89_08145 [Alicyclobacillus fastidiosus]
MRQASGLSGLLSVISRYNIAIAPEHRTQADHTYGGSEKMVAMYDPLAVMNMRERVALVLLGAVCFACVLFLAFLVVRFFLFLVALCLVAVLLALFFQACLPAFRRKKTFRKSKSRRPRR